MPVLNLGRPTLETVAELVVQVGHVRFPVFAHRTSGELAPTAKVLAVFGMDRPIVPAVACGVRVTVLLVALARSRVPVLAPAIPIDSDAPLTILLASQEIILPLAE
jgi:hypothetical protein